MHDCRSHAACGVFTLAMLTGAPLEAQTPAPAGADAAASEPGLDDEFDLQQALQRGGQPLTAERAARKAWAFE